jgi:multisubunit Na+/H+ antiporter MnhB subunit
MELDELKNIWKGTQPKESSNLKIMELIQNKNAGPLASLRRSFRKQIILMSVMPLLLMLSNFSNIDKVLTSVLFWSYVLFCIGVAIFARINYTIVGKMQGQDTMVKTNLEQQIILLEKRAKYELIAFRCALLYFAVLLEVLPYFQHFRMLDKWNSLNLFIRFGAYLLVAVFQYFMTTKVKHRKVGQHLESLKQLASQMN